MTEPLTLTLNLDLDRHLIAYRGTTDEGEALVEPQTVEDIVLDLAASKVAALVASEDKRDLRRRVQAISDEVIRERVVPLIEEAVTRALQPTDVYGQPKGQPTTLAEVITAKATRQLKASNPSNRSQSPTVLDDFIARNVRSALTRELTAALTEAQAEVTTVVRQEGAAVLEAAITRLATR